MPEDGGRRAYAEALAKAKAEEEALVFTKKLEKEVKKLSEQEAEAAGLAKEAKEAGSTLDSLLRKGKDFRSAGGFSWEKLTSQLTTAVSQRPEEEPNTQVAAVRGQAKAWSLLPEVAVVEPPASKPKPKKPDQPKPKPKQTEVKTEVRNVFGGLFKQETIYVDDDRVRSMQLSLSSFLECRWQCSSFV